MTKLNCFSTGSWQGFCFSLLWAKPFKPDVFLLMAGHRNIQEMKVFTQLSVPGALNYFLTEDVSSVFSADKWQQTEELGF